MFPSISFPGTKTGGSMQKLKTRKKQGTLCLALMLTTVLLTMALAIRARAYGAVSDVTGYAPGGWKIHHTDGHIQSSPPGMIFLDADTGEWLFCLQPHVDRVGGLHSTKTDLADYLGDRELAKRLSLIACFSMNSDWGYDGWAVGQSMIWQLLTQRNGEAGEQYLITPGIPNREVLQTYYDSVNQKVEQYLKAPSFDRSTITVEAGQAVSITDENGVLEDMEIVKTEGPATVSQNGNQLRIEARGTEAAEASVQLRKPLPGGTMGQSFVYSDGTLQDLMTCGFYEPLSASLRITITPAVTEVSFSKQDLTTGAELPGAELQVCDETGTVIDRWISGEEPHLIRGLIPGKRYTMTELSAPDGYVTAEQITFTAERNMEPVVMNDQRTNIKIWKVDQETQKPLEGAAMQLLNEDGDILDEWISGEEPKQIEKLTAGKRYRIHEASAPDGYLPTEDQWFTVPDSKEILEIRMEDPIQETETTEETESTEETEIPEETTPVEEPPETEDETETVGQTEPETTKIVPETETSKEMVPVKNGSTKRTVSTGDRMPAGVFGTIFFASAVLLAVCRILKKRQ